jgi:hypothetical protein
VEKLKQNSLYGLIQSVLTFVELTRDILSMLHEQCLLSWAKMHHLNKGLFMFSWYTAVWVMHSISSSYEKIKIKSSVQKVQSTDNKQACCIKLIQHKMNQLFVPSSANLNQWIKPMCNSSPAYFGRPESYANFNNKNLNIKGAEINNKVTCMS